jgi:hypothetical protein
VLNHPPSGLLFKPDTGNAEPGLQLVKIVCSSIGMMVAPIPTLCLHAWEAAWWMRRRFQRRKLYDQAQTLAKETGRKLVVVGDPKGGVTHDDYGCGDMCVDLTGCPDCVDSAGKPNGVTADIGKPGAIPLPDDSAVVFVSCVLEYVPDFDEAVTEILRVAGSPDNVFVVRVEPWTFTSTTYPGARRTLTPDGLDVHGEIFAPLPLLGERTEHRASVGHPVPAYEQESEDEDGEAGSLGLRKAAHAASGAAGLLSMGRTLVALGEVDSIALLGFV